MQGVLAARIDLLQPREKRTLQQASVVGRIFWRGAVAALSRTTRRSIPTFAGSRSASSSRARVSSTMVGEEELAFSHILTRDVAYESLPAPRAAARACPRRALDRGDRPAIGSASTAPSSPTTTLRHTAVPGATATIRSTSSRSYGSARSSCCSTRRGTRSAAPHTVLLAHSRETALELASSTPTSVRPPRGARPRRSARCVRRRGLGRVRRRRRRPTRRRLHRLRPGRPAHRACPRRASSAGPGRCSDLPDEELAQAIPRLRARRTSTRPTAKRACG